MTTRNESVGKKSDQSARFIEAAKKTGADETGKPFEKALKAVLRRHQEDEPVISATSRKKASVSKK
jgi:hypothetical protein